MRYLDIDYDFFTIPELSSVTAFADSMDKRIDAAELLKLIDSEDGPFKNRKEFCEAFGIGESTLSGWLKGGDRIPKIAKLCVGLLNAKEVFMENCSRLEQRLDAIKNSDRIVRDGDRFMIVSFNSGETYTAVEDVAVIGDVAARDISDEKTARRLISHQNVKDTLRRLWDELSSEGISCLEEVNGEKASLAVEIEQLLNPNLTNDNNDNSVSGGAND